jgi:hypothetical protein
MRNKAGGGSGRSEEVRDWWTSVREFEGFPQHHCTDRRIIGFDLSVTPDLIEHSHMEVLW